MTTDEKPVDVTVRPDVAPADDADAQAIADDITHHVDQQNARLLMLHGKYAPLTTERFV